MNAKQKKLAVYGAGGLLVLLLLYRYYKSKAGATANATGVDPSSRAASDYASLAGQEQADIANLGNQIAGLQGQFAGVPTQQQLADYQSTLLQDLLNFENQVTGWMAGFTPPPAGGTGNGNAGGKGQHGKNSKKIPPKGAPKTAKWSGRQKPGKGWTGIGGGWWVPPHKSTNGDHGGHGTDHQSGHAGHNRGHNSGGVAPSTHNQKRGGYRKPTPTAPSRGAMPSHHPGASPGHHPAPAHHNPPAPAHHHPPPPATRKRHY